jgi:hypothetical protein
MIPSVTLTSARGPVGSGRAIARRIVSIAADDEQETAPVSECRILPSTYGQNTCPLLVDEM